jgi:acyl-CoA thioesterase-1
MVDLVQRAGAKPVLIGIQLPPNYGPRYNDEFAKMYGDIARAKRTPLVPFLLQSVALNESLMQADGLHANERGQPLLLDNVWPELKPLLKR